MLGSVFTSAARKRELQPGSGLRTNSDAGSTRARLMAKHAHGEQVCELELRRDLEQTRPPLPPPAAPRGRRRAARSRGGSRGGRGSRQGGGHGARGGRVVAGLPPAARPRARPGPPTGPPFNPRPGPGPPVVPSPDRPALAGGQGASRRGSGVERTAGAAWRGVLRRGVLRRGVLRRGGRRRACGCLCSGGSRRGAGLSGRGSVGGGRAGSNVGRRRGAVERRCGAVERRARRAAAPVELRRAPGGRGMAAPCTLPAPRSLQRRTGRGPRPGRASIEACLAGHDPRVEWASPRCPIPEDER
jgi:hypothetical protein